MVYYKVTQVKVFVTMVFVLWFSRTGDACFPSKYWISCLIDTCKLGGKCPGDPTAQCKMEKTKCNGCKPTWYKKTGEKANCSVQRNLKLCPGGEKIVHCKVDSCKWPCAHPDFKGAACRQGYCGECRAEYFIKDAWANCPVSTTGTAGEMLPIDSVLGNSCLKVRCAIDICINKRCSKVPRAVCRPDGCNECKPAWFLDNVPVDCNTGEFVTNKPGFKPLVPSSQKLPPWQRECAYDEQLINCDMKVCEKKICRNFPNAQCRPDGCGKCKDTWYVNNKLVDCFSDECPPKVPIVKCVDDPCKYFGHYCPAAECRASQCGKCEAKFFANGQEIDCAMPPKECPAGVIPRTCPWYTCPANICPSDRRLMCRIDPCGSKCNYEFIDIYNGEPLLCRVFDGDGRYIDNAQQNNQGNAGTDVGQPPLLGDLVPSGTSRFDSSNNLRPDSSGGNFVGKASLNPTGTSNARGNTGFVAQPVFINPGPPITDPDILSLLRAFPHEMINIPSAMIQSALKKSNGISPVTQAQKFTETVPGNTPVSDQSLTIFEAANSAPQTATVPRTNIEQPMKKGFGVSETVIDNQLLDLAPKTAKQYPELLGDLNAQHGASGHIVTQPDAGTNIVRDPDAGFLSQTNTLVNQPLIEANHPSKPIYPKLTSVGSGLIAAGQPSNMNSNLLATRVTKDKSANMNSNLLTNRQTIDKPAKTKKSKSKASGAKVSAPVKQRKGVPISFGLFSQWALG